MTESEEKVEKTRENRSFFSKKLVKGKNKSAIKTAKKSGAKIPCPIMAK